MTNAKKQTAANNAALRRVKKAMNGLIYKGTAEALNRGGVDEARAYLGQFFHEGSRARRLTEFFGPAA